MLGQDACSWPRLSVSSRTRSSLVANRVHRSAQLDSKSNLARRELLLIGSRDAKWSRRNLWFCLWHENQDDCNGHETHACHTQQASRIAESLRNNSSY